MPRICVCLPPRPQVFRHSAYCWASQGNLIRLLGACRCPRALRRSRWIVRGTPRMNIWFARVRMAATRVGSTVVLRYPRLTSAAIRPWRVSALSADSLTGNASAKASVLRMDGKACRTRVVVTTPRPPPPPWARPGARDGARAQAATATPRGSRDGAPPPRHSSA
jgi:hypothetical protein